MTKTVSAPRGGVRELLAMLGGIAMFWVMVALALVDLHAFLWFGRGSESTGVTWLLGLCGIGYLATLVGLALAAYLRRRRFAIGIPVVGLGLGLHVLGLVGLFRGQPLFLVWALVS
ncbi:hypothetical protein [Embleya sp. AB8]|uniref:hypothetical protein n=1 Tax=Embleya sp. AB8 TaxID=3156304 RepID=UPI003C786EDB